MLFGGEGVGTESFWKPALAVYISSLLTRPCVVISRDLVGGFKTGNLFDGFSVKFLLVFFAGMRGHAEFCRLGSDEFL